MIPQAYIQAWREHAPWPHPAQVEQDLIICRALCDLFNAPALAGKIAFRGGTAIHKLLFKQPLRYSEDIDQVQTQAEPIGPTVDAIRDALAWLGKCKREQAGHSMHLVFRFAPESAPQATQIQHVLVIELKKGGFELTRKEVNQADGYVQDIAASGAMSGSPFICAWVVGQKIAAGVERDKQLGNPAYGRVRAVTFGLLVDTANARLLKLRTVLADRYGGSSTDELLNRVFLHPTQDGLGI